jgi:hypothetical protein
MPGHLRAALPHGYAVRAREAANAAKAGEAAVVA